MNQTKRHLIEAEKREVLGRKVKKLRTEGILPASVYGKDFKSISIQMDAKMAKVAFSELGEAGLFDLKVDKDTFPVFFKNPQFHPVSGEMIHVDLYKVNLKEKTTVAVPVEHVGESQSVKLGNVLVVVTDEVEVEALPTDLPEKFEIDLSKLETLEDMITVADIAYDKSKMTILTEASQVLVKTEEPKEEEIVIAEAPPEVEGGEKKEGEEEVAEEKPTEDKKETEDKE